MAADVSSNFAVDVVEAAPADRLAIVELELPPGVSPRDAVLEMPTISHLSASSAQLKAAPDPFKAIGSSGSCEVDVACTADPPAVLLSAASSVTEVSPNASRARMALRVGSTRAAKVRSSRQTRAVPLDDVLIRDRQDVREQRQEVRQIDGWGRPGYELPVQEE